MQSKFAPAGTFNIVGRLNSCRRRSDSCATRRGCLPLIIYEASRVSFAHTRVSILGWIYDPDHSLPPGMYVDVPHLDCLLVAAPITLEGLDHLILKPKQLDGVVAVNVDEVLGHVAMALSKKS